MAKLTRVFQKVFGSAAALGEIGKFGSLAAGTPVTTTDPDVVQELGNFEGGWGSAIVGSNSPALEDMNAVHFLAFRQLAYLLQQGIAEYDAETTYYTDSLVMDQDGVIYESLVDDNVGEDLTDGTKFRIFNESRKVETISSSDTLDLTQKIILVDTSGGDVILGLPEAATAKGKIYHVKKISTDTNYVSYDPNASELIEGVSAYSNGVYLKSHTLVCDGTGWYII